MNEHRKCVCGGSPELIYDEELVPEFFVWCDTCDIQAKPEYCEENAWKLWDSGKVS